MGSHYSIVRTTSKAARHYLHHTTWIQSAQGALLFAFIIIQYKLFIYSSILLPIESVSPASLGKHSGFIGQVSDPRQLVVDIISTGSINRNELQQAQRITFGSHPSVRHFYAVNEHNDTESSCFQHVNGTMMVQIARWHCSKFGRRSHGINETRFPYLYHLTRNYHGYDKIKSKGRGWLCAQKRPIDVLYQVLTHRRDEPLPDYLFVIDDDTWLRIPSLLKILSIQYPPEEAHFVAGCMVNYWDRAVGMHDDESTVVIQGSIAPFQQSFPVGGLGSFWSRGLLENLMRPITDCGHSPPAQSSTLWQEQRSVCQQIQANLIGEGSLFQSGMSVLDLMHRYTFDQAYMDVYDWNDIGFCLHSDMVLGYFVTFYKLAPPGVGLDASTWHIERRIDKDPLKMVDKYMNKTNLCFQTSERHCDEKAAVCHYMSATRMLELGMD